MSREKTKNQVHPISGKQELRKIIFKNRSGASIPLFKNIDPSNAQIRVKALKRLYTDWKGEFIITR